MSKAPLDKPPIHDLFFRRVKTVEGVGIKQWPALSDSDHLLRRFGQVEIVHLGQEAIVEMRVREVADEVWVLVEGSVEFIWKDLRENSPSYNQEFRLICEEPTLVLVPFGVAFGQRPLSTPAILVRVSTHADGQHDGDSTYVDQE